MCASKVRDTYFRLGNFYDQSSLQGLCVHNGLSILPRARKSPCCSVMVKKRLNIPSLSTARNKGKRLGSATPSWFTGEGGGLFEAGGRLCFVGRGPEAWGGGDIGECDIGGGCEP